MTLTSNIVIRFAVEGFHRWPGASPHRAYLADRHRHLFHVEVGITVFEDDREIEFHDFMGFCKGAFPGGEMGDSSCEHMCKTLVESITRRYPNRRVIVSVFEDGEAGATVIYAPE